MWLLPWEKWLPAWIVGPAMVIGSVGALVFDRNLHWWEYLLLPSAALMGVWVTYLWHKDGRHAFREEGKNTGPTEKDRP